ncbi:winged helix-turn-helix domain-containing protein [Schumannella sp. 10F1B-5-1]|uniref:winged helix-turn-helix domain-containing protein n=1 Tax=Schumannella sp. 10F1B-5-1 TaxID=2590780 RepID=UPI0011323CD6|nr:crosslink repair DNA glycosylase YcaQ family protein [Schumannella sp. 10F1B-5-1]TPW73064.1 winged helix-turn-helix domain-containing protein [Schumannella sp. 10F1B-5-1]
MVDEISPALARRIALAAQGFGRPRPDTVGTRQLNGVIDRLGLLQLDSVNVYERSHYLPVFARLGGYDKALLDRLTFRPGGPKAQYFEYWAHEAALLPIGALPLIQWRMQEYRERSHRASDSWARENTAMLDFIRAELAEKGPLAASEIEHDANKRNGPWWGWSDVKTALEILFRWGEVFSAGRTRFERRYGLPEQVLPAGALDAPLPRDEAVRELVRRSLVAHGIGTPKDIADYYRLKVEPTKQALRELADAGLATPVAVPGWSKQAWLDPTARKPRRVETVALLSPFDPVVWERARTEKLFGFHYRIEIYTPAPQRRFGYYTLPLLVDEQIAGRIDLKSDRARGVLRVQSAWTEPGAPAEVEQRIQPLLQQIAAWQGLDAGIEVADWGDLAPRVAGALGVPLLPRG